MKLAWTSIVGVPGLVAAADEPEAIDLVHPGRFGEVVRRTVVSGGAARGPRGWRRCGRRDERGGGCLLGEIHAGARDHDGATENVGDVGYHD